MASQDIKHLASSEFVAGKPPEEQNKHLQEFVQPHIESFNYMLDNGIKTAAQVSEDDQSISEDNTSTLEQNTEATEAINTAPTDEQPQPITIDLPPEMHGDAINATTGDTANSNVLPTEYMNILDIVLDNSKGNLQTVGGNPTLVLAEVDNASGGVVAVSQADGSTITLTAEQVTALTQAAARGESGLSIITPDEQPSQSSNEEGMLTEDVKSGIVNDEKDIVMKDDNGDNIEFQEEEDSNDTNQVMDTISTMPVKDKNSLRFKCNECDRPYVTKAALKKHLLLVHNKELDVSLQKASNKCIHPGCDKIFYHRQKMIDHLKEAHDVSCVQEDLVFNSWEEFLLWKEKEEDANFVHFSKNSTHTNAKNYMLTNFTCQREGKAGYKYTGSQQKKYKDLVIGEKICPARMRARLDKPTGRVTVQYCKSHNHKLSFQDFLYRRMPDRLRNEIREKLASGMSSEEVYKDLKSADNLRESRGERFAPSKRQFVTLVNIKTIAKRMNIKEPGISSKNFVLEAEPLAIQMQKLLDESFNPVLLYKEQGSSTEFGPEDIDQLTGAHELSLIAIQTKEQKEMFIKHGHKIVFIDITEAVITPTQYVVTVKVLDEYNKGYPVAFLISNSRDETVLFYFFREMQNRLADSSLKVNSVMTENSCNEYYAFRSVFGEDVKHLLCKWNLHRAWCQKIHEECAGDEALQQELYFIFVTMLEEQDLTKFDSIANEFINNYQTRCPNFINFFMTNYLSQPEVWASCYRNNPLSDCDEVLYADRIHERIRKEIKNNRKVKSLDDVLDMLLRFEHEDYFNRGLNLMLNPPEPHLILSEHSLGMKIKNASVVENYSAQNRWQVKTTKRDPADLQNIKEETFIVTWKADICEKDFCRERCLKLACFGLCGHLYHCSCDGDPVTPCRHIHKVHSMRIGVTQYQNDDEEEEGKEVIASKVDGSSIIESSIDTASSSTSQQKEDTPKLNLINQITPTSDPYKRKNAKIREIKMELVKLYKFLESDNVQKYSLDFIETGLKKVLDECNVIDSIGQSKSEDIFRGKRKHPDKDLDEFEQLVNSMKRKKVMGTSVPVIVEIEPNPAIYNTFRKRITGSKEETPEDRMLRLSKSKHVTINIVSDEKYRRTQSQHVTSTPGIIVAKEGEEGPLIVEGEELPVEYYQPDDNDAEWTPRGQRKGKRGRPRKRPIAKTSTIKIQETSIPALASVSDPRALIISNGPHKLSMADIKCLDINVSDEEKAQLSEYIPNYSPGFLSNAIVNSYLHNLSQRAQVLYLTLEQMEALASNRPYTDRYWKVEDVSGPARKQYIVGPWRNSGGKLVAFVIDLENSSIFYFDPASLSVEFEDNVKDLQSTLVGLMVVEIPFDNTRDTQTTWTISTIERLIELDGCNQGVRCLWYINQFCTKLSLTDSTVSMETFRKVVYQDVAGHSMSNFLEM